MKCLESKKKELETDSVFNGCNGKALSISILNILSQPNSRHPPIKSQLFRRLEKFAPFDTEISGISNRKIRLNGKRSWAQLFEGGLTQTQG